jgi:hypothetical protein
MITEMKAALPSLQGQQSQIYLYLICGTCLYHLE